jgi:hypothetical protein
MWARQGTLRCMDVLTQCEYAAHGCLPSFSPTQRDPIGTTVTPEEPSLRSVSAKTASSPWLCLL